MQVFGQDPEVFLLQEHIQPRCVVDPARPAQLVPELRTYVNYEVFFFCDAAAKAAFEKDPVRYCGVLTDPVSRHRFRPAPGALHRDYMGRAYYFQSDSTLAVFTADPDSFAVRKGM